MTSSPTTVRRPRRIAALAGCVLAGALTLGGCAAGGAPDATQVSPAASETAGGTAGPGAGTASEATEALLARNGLAGLDVRTIVETLDASEEDRTAGPVGSVRARELVLTDAEGEAVLPMPEDAFYLAVAPYLTTTHPCTYHNLASCSGELADVGLLVEVTDASGATVLDETVTTHANGFAGLWLPRNLTGTLRVTYDGKTASTPIATGDDDLTCLTTLQLA